MTLSQATRVLRITEIALREATTYARLVDEHLGPYECLGYLAGAPDGNVVSRAILATGRVTAGSVEVDGRSVLAASREIENLGLQPRGWFHSHGLHPTYHSHQDDENTRLLLQELAASSWHYLDEEALEPPVCEGGVIRVTDGHEVIEIRSTDDHLSALESAGLTAVRRTPVGLAYSLVVNARGETPYAEVHTRRWCERCQTEEFDHAVASVELVPQLDEEAMVEEILEKLEVRSGLGASTADEALAESAVAPVQPPPNGRGPAGNLGSRGPTGQITTQLNMAQTVGLMASLACGIMLPPHDGRWRP